MSEYNQYVKAVNKIFDYLEKMKAGWNSLDNLNYIGNIEEYKQIVAASVELFKPGAKPNTASQGLEELGND